jgi:hypothetical protein
MTAIDPVWNATRACGVSRRARLTGPTCHEIHSAIAYTLLSGSNSDASCITATLIATRHGLYTCLSRYSHDQERMSVILLTHYHFTKIISTCLSRMSRCVWSIISPVPACLITKVSCQLSLLAFYRYVKSCQRLVGANCSRYPIDLRGGPSSL